jgi:hypothetical protein
VPNHTVSMLRRINDASGWLGKIELSLLVNWRDCAFLLLTPFYTFLALKYNASHQEAINPYIRHCANKVRMLIPIPIDMPL